MKRRTNADGVADAETVVGVRVRQPPAQRDIHLGATVGGYRLEARLGQGGMGVVYRARHVHLDRTVALKLLTPDLAASESFRARFIRESRLAASLRHPNIVTIFDAGESEGSLYIAMQLVDGGDLAALLARHQALAPERVLEILGQVASALDTAHGEGLVHRDVKPANILVDRDQCYLTDFGLTKHVSSETALTAAGDMVGTVDYLAPEQIEATAVDSRVDVYALGCVLYHCLAGSPPYRRDSDMAVLYAHMQVPPPPLSDARPDLPPALTAVVAKAMAKARDDRYRSCGEMAAAARAAFGIAEPPSPATPRPAAHVLIDSDDPATRALLRAALSSTLLEPIEPGEAEPRAARLVIVDAATFTDEAGHLGLVSAAERPPVLVVAQRGAEVPAALAALADAVIRQPFSAVQLLVRVRELLGPEMVPG